MAAVKKITHKVKELELNCYKPDWSENKTIQPIVDMLAVGEQKLRSSTLATFNQKMKRMMDGNMFEVKEDEIPSINFASPDDTCCTE